MAPISRSLEVPLLWGVNASSDFVPSISLHFEDPDVASLVIDLPGVPGASTTPADGNSAAQGEAQVWWSLHGGGDSGEHLAAYGHACSVSFEADAAGRLSGSIRCPRERLDRQRRYRASVDFEATPLLRGPLPTPMPTPSPAPPSVTDAPCALVDDAAVSDALNLKSGRLLLLDAGPGQCVGLVADEEAVFLSVRDDAATLELAGDGSFRGATCTPLPAPALGDASSAASCTWPDERSVVAGNVLQGTVSVVVSLASGTLPPDALAAGVEVLLAGALDRLP